MARNNLSLVGVLLKKQWQERISTITKGKSNIIWFCLRLLLIGMLIAVFIIFFGKFLDIYIQIKTEGAVQIQTRLFELLAIAYFVIIVMMIISGISQINRSIFKSDDIKLFSAMPISSQEIFISKLIPIFLNQFFFTLLTVFSVNICVALHSPQSWWFYLITLGICFIIPIISLAIASILALPFYLIKNFLYSKFVLNFIVVTLVSVGLIYLYFFVLTGLKDLLLGDDLKFFFTGSVMHNISLFSNSLYPSNWIANLVLGKDLLVSGLSIFALIICCGIISILVIKKLLKFGVQLRISGTPNFVLTEKEISPKTNTFFALIKKDFLLILRTPTYMFSYFSVMVVMPLMVYFCMSIGSSLVVKLIGIDARLEIGIFLTLLFGALTNVFCATNISREGEIFYSIKAMPISCKMFFSSKIVLCMIVATLSQIASSLFLFFTGFLNLGMMFFVLSIGVILSFAQICFATRYDFNHVKFSTEDDGEVVESSNSIGIFVLFGLFYSILVGGTILLGKFLNVAQKSYWFGWTYIIVSVVTILTAVFAYIYLINNLQKRYYEFCE